MNESKFCREIKESLKMLYPNCKLFKVHGGLYQTPGLGDLIGCIYGKYIEIETKVVKKWPHKEDGIIWRADLFTANQIDSMQKTLKAGGISYGFVLIEPLKLFYMLSPNNIYLGGVLTRRVFNNWVNNGDRFIVYRTASFENKWENLRGKIF